MQKSNEPLVSIIFPVFNASAYLEECLDSIAKQSYKRLQIILVDDGSSDRSADICEQYACSDARFTVVRQKNRGVSSARNTAIRIADGDYVLFVDADDKVDRSFVEAMVASIETNQAEMAICGCWVDAPRKKRKLIPTYTPKNGADLCDAMICKTGIKGYCWNKIYRTKVIKSNGILFSEKLKLAEDMHFNAQYAKFISKVAILRFPLYIYRRRSRSATDTLRSAEVLEKAVEEMKKITPGEKAYVDYLLLAAKIESGGKLDSHFRKLYKAFVRNPYVPIAARIRMRFKHRLSGLYSIYLGAKAKNRYR